MFILFQPTDALERHKCFLLTLYRLEYYVY